MVKLPKKNSELDLWASLAKKEQEFQPPSPHESRRLGAREFQAKREGGDLHSLVWFGCKRSYEN